MIRRISHDEWRAFYRQVSLDLHVEALGETWLGSEIADETRVVDFADYYRKRSDLPAVMRDKLAQVVWESIEGAWSKRVPSDVELRAASEVLIDAQDNEDFCWYMATVVLFGSGKLKPWPELVWLFDLPGLRLDDMLRLAAQRLERLVKDIP